MAIADAVKKKIGREAVEWIYLGIRTGARRAVNEYRSLMAQGRTEEATNQIKRAVDMPHRARARIDYAIANYGGPALNEALTLAGTVTWSEINAELTILENYAQGLVDHVNIDGWTWDQVADNIEANVEHEADRWVFPIPPGYLDVWGE